MIDSEFEWDDAKAARNLRVRGIGFEAAREVFRDHFVLDWLDMREDYGEERYGAIGMVQDRLLHVAYTIRNERIRVISVRKAEPHERRKYHERRKQEEKD
jgi:hypothetical protein